MNRIDSGLIRMNPNKSDLFRNNLDHSVLLLVQIKDLIRIHSN